MKNAKITLEDINLRKKELKNEILIQKEAIAQTTRAIFAPLTPAANKTDALMRSFNTGMAVFDGIMIGVKVIRKLRRYLRKLK